MKFGITKKELIKKLELLPDEARICLEDYDGHEHPFSIFVHDEDRGYSSEELEAVFCILDVGNDAEIDIHGKRIGE